MTDPMRAARHDDRAFGAERTARPDRDRRRNRLQHRQPRLYFAAVDQDGFQRLRNAVAANPLGAVVRHQSDHQSAGHRDQHRQPAQVVSRRRNKHRAHSPVVEDIREKSDQAQQRPRDERAQDADADRQQRNRNDSRRRGKIAEPLRIVLVCYSRCQFSPCDAAARNSTRRASSGPERSSSARCASASLRRVARPAGVSRTHTSRLSRVPGCLATAPVASSRFTSSTAL